MKPHEKKHSSPGESRRRFITKTAVAATAVTSSNLLCLPLSAQDRSGQVSIVFDPADAVAQERPVRWAANQLREALERRGVEAQLHERLDQAPAGQTRILAASRTSRLARQLLDAANIALPQTPEALGLARGEVGTQPVLLASGSDARGLVYALLELADRVGFAERPLTALAEVKPIVEKPANAIRSVARLFTSDVEDKSWFNDRAFWDRYLTTLATQRFNRFSLTFGIGYDFTTSIRDCYFHFAYPFLLSVPGYHVRAHPLPDAERDQNLEMLKLIGEETARRGLHFQLGLWTHAYQWTNSPAANYTIEGLTPETHAAYCRDALAMLLKACPAISGVTFRIHGESGVPEASYDFWRTVFDGVVKCGRRVEIDMHAKGMDQAMIDVALATGMPVNVSPKFWAEHMGLPYMQGAIRPLEMPPREARDAGFFSRSSGSRRFLRYGYGDLLAEDRRHGVLHRIWPGTQRLLLWADPEIAAGYGRASSFCGSAGVELCEPLSFKGRKGSGLPGGRDAYAEASLRPARGDFEKYLFTHRMWGRCIYNPDCDADGWQRAMKKEFGAGAAAAETALASAGKILPLVTTAHCPSAANNNYWPEVYTNMSIVDATKRHPYGDTLNPKRFGAVSSLDPEFFSRIDDFAGELLNPERSAKYSPVWCAAQLQDAAARAEVFLRDARSKVRDPRSAEFRRLDADVSIQAGLGLFFAWKFRAGVLFALFERSGHRPALEEALNAYRKARTAWAELAERAKAVYRSDISFGYDKHSRGHWLDRLPAIDEDIADMEKLFRQLADDPAAPLKVERQVVEAAVRAVLESGERSAPPALERFHAPPKSFARGKPLLIEASLIHTKNVPKLASIRLRYRRVNQAEVWQAQEMQGRGAEFQTVIPAEYSDSPFPLQYHFELRPVSGTPWLYPGIPARWERQPYFVLRRKSEPFSFDL
ncbi:MAG: hypothetical protein HYY23_12535 [Verrucomicrobia bacterium]|nr:hypothetical protein [Verrucomicrobiota bacterium]